MCFLGCWREGEPETPGGICQVVFLVFQDETGEKDSPSCQQCFQKDPVWILPRDVYEGWILQMRKPSHGVNMNCRVKMQMRMMLHAILRIFFQRCHNGIAACLIYILWGFWGLKLSFEGKKDALWIDFQICLFSPRWWTPPPACSLPIFQRREDGHKFLLPDDRCSVARVFICLGGGRRCSSCVRFAVWTGKQPGLESPAVGFADCLGGR